MKRTSEISRLALLTFSLAAVLITITSAQATAGVSFADPSGGWRYQYNGTFGASIAGLPPGYGDTSQQNALDGTWEHDQADKWDGSGIGDTQNPGSQTIQKSPGGVSALTEGSTSFIRMQDTGNPEASTWGFIQGTNRPINNNRRMYFGHMVSSDGALPSQLIMDNGITLSFRARIPNPATNVLDPIYPDPSDTITGAGGATTPLPWGSIGGGGYPIHDGGRGMFNVVQNDPSFFNTDSGVAFSLMTSKDRAVYSSSSPVLSGDGGTTGGLIMNNLNGNTPSSAVDTFSDGTLNLLPMTDRQLYQWNDYWITIQADPDSIGTHLVKVYLDGSTTPTIFHVTASADNNSEYKNNAWIAMGMSSTNFFGSLDVDYFSCSLGAITPVSTELLGDLNRDGHVNAADILALQGALANLDSYETAKGLSDGDVLTIGDVNHDGKFNNADLQAFLNYLKTGHGSDVSVPEPSSAVLALGMSLCLGLVCVGNKLKGSGILRNGTPKTVLVFAVSITATAAFGQQPTEAVPESAVPHVIDVPHAADIQKVLDAAPPHSVVRFNSNQQLILATPLVVSKPLTLRGLNAKLPAELGRSSLITVTAKGVTIEDFELHGNTDSVEQNQRAALIRLEAGDFRVEHGLVVDASKHGVYVVPTKETGDIVGGVIRDIVGRRNSRCVVGIGDAGNEGVAVRNVVVENIRCYDGRLRGAVNLKDGNDNITIRDVYSENSVYAVDVQDHKKPGEVNKNIIIEDVYAVNCRHAIRTNNQPLGHENLTVRNVTAVHCAIPIRISNTEHVTLDNIRVLDHTTGDEVFPPILVSNCKDVSLRDVIIKDSNYEGPAVSIVDSDHVLVDGLTLEGSLKGITRGVEYLITGSDAFTGLRISHVFAPRFKEGSIVLESKGDGGKLSNYVIAENLADVVDHIQGRGALLANNIPPDNSAVAETGIAERVPKDQP